ncbi:hypothetical protein MF271_15320 [Deinococcus sp. KNUC1210]|uniref:DapH/DapD/GlmU-related protein n=1 Tax=Deinococcus sp. KNUC1210 TaxID=2917691 RepID=UPI001EF04CD9|nr:DapH/DapD/GlmU-related protein [Deinococcus sp. KNUC1210]ULH15296.1 hypothetical protein MF271_15320 [Deinococcus sp. KNUC1210]
MYKALEIYQRDGVLPLIAALSDRIHSAIIRRKFNYPDGFLIGRDTVWLTGKYAVIGKGLRIGRRCRIETISRHNGHSFNPKLIIGSNVSMSDDVHIACSTSVSIGDNVLLASKIFITDHNHGEYKKDTFGESLLPPNDRILISEPVYIDKNVWIGEMVTILPGVRIGEGSIIGSNSVVSKSIPRFCIAAGVPAKVIKRYSEETGIWERVYE